MYQGRDCLAKHLMHWLACMRALHGRLSLTGFFLLLLGAADAKKYAVILAFDVTVGKEARELSEEFGVKIFTADIIYHLFDQFTVRDTWGTALPLVGPPLPPQAGLCCLF